MYNQPEDLLVDSYIVDIPVSLDIKDLSFFKNFL